MNESIITLRKDRNKWKQFKYQNLGYLNKNTLHTFGSVYSHLCEYFTNLVNRLSDVHIEKSEVEHPVRDKSFMKIYDTNKKMVERTALPRAVMLYNLDVNYESDYKIPNQHRLNWLSHTRVAEVFDIKYSYDDNFVDYLQDLTMDVVGNIQESLATVFYTILTDSKAAHVELTKKIKMAFPDDGWYPVYRTEHIDPKTERVTEIPYSVEYRLPDELIENLKKVLRVDSDEKLNEFLKKYSYNKVTYKISGEDQKYAFYVELFSTIKIKCNAIDDGIYTQENNITTYACKLEFTVRYIDLSAFKMSIIGYILNVCNRNNFYVPQDHTDKETLVAPIYHIEKPTEVNGTTEFNSYEIEYIEEDLRTYYIDPKTGKFVPPTYIGAKEVEYITLPLCDITDNSLVSEYIQYISDEYGTSSEEFEKYINILLYSKQVESPTEIISNKYMSVYKDYITKRIVDRKHKPGDQVYISIYLNMEHFNKWRIDNGYNNVENLSAK